jgi:hypothetical protein
VNRLRREAGTGLAYQAHAVSDGVGSAPARSSQGRSIGFWVLIVVAGVLLLLSAFAVWVNRVALNTGVFADTSTSLLDNDQIRSAVATRAVDELFTSVDVQAELQAQLPQDWKSLSGVAAAGARQASYQVVDRALEQPAFQRLFAISLEESHATLVEVLEGGGSRVSTQGGEVTLDLRAIVRETADRIGIGEQVADRIPADAGQIVVLRSDQLDTAQDAFQLLKTLAWVLPILTLAAFAGAVWLRTDRRKAVRGVGVAVLVVGALGLVAANLTGNYIVNSLVSERDTRPAANDAWDILTELMRGSFRLLIVVGILFLVASWLAGPGPRAVASRRALAPALRGRLWPYVVLAIIAAILLMTSTVNDAGRYLAVLLLVALGATWIELTRRQTQHEFPDATGSAILAEARTRFSAWWEQWRAPAASSASAAPVQTDLSARLASLADLHGRGELSDDEYTAAKARVLAGD